MISTTESLSFEEKERPSSSGSSLKVDDLSRSSDGQPGSQVTQQFNIRRASQEDIDILTNMCIMYFSEENPQITPSYEHIKNYTGVHIKLGSCVVLEYNQHIVGVLGWIEMPDQFSGELIIRKSTWYVVPEYRGTAGSLLLDYLENHAKQIGAKAIWMSALNTPVAKYLEKHDYKPIELQYIKRIN
jgi:N-acetylglutamate synthase-like GNAT family acetyltransferase